MLTKRKESCIKYDFKTMTFLIVHYSDWTVILEKALSQQWNVFLYPPAVRGQLQCGEHGKNEIAPQRLQIRKLKEQFFLFCVCICLPKILFCFLLHRCVPDPQES